MRSAISAGYASLSQNINKVRGKDTTDETAEGAVSDFLPELSLAIPNEELIKITENWEKTWTESAVRAKWLSQVDANEAYWGGKHFNRAEIENLRPLIDNIIFEGTETFLPAATRQNPEPSITLKATEEENELTIKYTEIIRNRLVDWSDEVKFRLKLKKAGRHWFLSLVGVAKMGWDIVNDRPSCKIIRPKRLILDPDGATDEDGYHGRFVGEYRKLEASVLVAIIEKGGEKGAVDFIKKEAHNNMGTNVQFIEWWTNEYTCWTLHDQVLLKKKNPHWNYDKAQPAEEPVNTEGGDISAEFEAPRDSAPDEGTEDTTTETNEELREPVASPYMQPSPIKGQNHLAEPTMPYRFLTIFNLGKGPVDETSLITQVLPQQDVVNKRLKQIDANADNMNNGLVVSGEHSGLNAEEATQVARALQRGGTVYIPAGDPRMAVFKPQSVPLSSDVFANLIDQRNRFKDIIGISGMQPSGLKSERTASGKAQMTGLDTDRIGGGVTEYLEQFADDIYNYCIQLMYVYDDTISGMIDKGAQVPKIRASVKEGSLLPKDPVSKAEEAVSLAGSGAMSLIDLYKALEYSNPEEMAANVWLQANAPEILFKDNKEVQEAIQQKAQQAQQMAQAEAAANQPEEKPPSESISFKDLPPEGKVQMAAHAGIQLNPQAVAQHELAREAATASIREKAKHLAPQKSALPAKSNDKK